jgi:Fe-S cluster assembly scaffold protein SufB
MVLFEPVKAGRKYKSEGVSKPRILHAGASRLPRAADVISTPEGVNSMAAAVPRYEEWLSLDRIRDLSSMLHDPPAVAAARVDAHERFLHLPIEPNPLYRGYGYFTNVDLSGIDPQAKGASVELPEALDRSVRIVHDASGTHATVPPELAAAGVRVSTLPALWASGAEGAEALFPKEEEATDRLSALATALVNRGYRLELPDRLAGALRVQELTVLSTRGEALSVRRSIRTGAETQLLLTEEAFSTGQDGRSQRFLGSTTDLTLGEGSKAVCLTVHAPDLRAVSVYRRSATTAPGARLGWLWVGLGGFRTKVRNRTTLAGAGSVVEDLQMFYGAKDQSYDSSVDITHVGTDTHGSSITRGVFTDDARGMSRGLVRIQHEARKTIAFVSEHAMLLSRGARADSIPILEILCRDVKATHSTSVHPADPEKIFYLESRGIAEPEAVRMIGEGFLSYVLDHAPIADLQKLLQPALDARWHGSDLPWQGRQSPTLPALEVTGSENAPEWRFDSKLR